MMVRWLAALIALAIAFPAIAAPRILIFSHSTGFRHASIEPGVAALKALAAREGIETVASEDPAVFDGDGLKGFAAIVFVNSTTDPRKPESEWFAGARRDSLQAFVRGGGGIVGIHAAADSHHHWPWYTRLIGGRFARHPEGTPKGTLARVADHPATRGMPGTFERVDEWYYYEDYDPASTLLVTLDPASIGEKDANPNPISWARRFEGGRVFYTGFGHTAESFSEPLVIAHILGGLRWAMGEAQALPAVIVAEEKTLRREPPPHGNIGMSTAYRISDGVPERTMEFRKRVLDPGAAIGIHAIAHDEVYYVLSGEGDVTSDGTTTRLKPGMAAYLYTGAQVGIRQVGAEPLALIISYPVVKE